MTPGDSQREEGHSFILVRLSNRPSMPPKNRIMYFHTALSSQSYLTQNMQYKPYFIENVAVEQVSMTICVSRRFS